jgi:hypothetical protein
VVQFRMEIGAGWFSGTYNAVKAAMRTSPP